MKKSLVIIPMWVLLTVSTVVAAQTPEQAKPLTEPERMLLDRVESLEKRVEALEKILVSQQAPPSVTPEQGVTDRAKGNVETIEKKTTVNPNELQARWNNGLQFETGNGRFRLKIGGRVHSDAAWFDQDTGIRRTFGNEQDGVESRRARITLKGDIYDNVFYAMDVGFAGDTGQARLKDVYMGLRDVPYLGTLTVGHFKEPFGLEELTSSNDIAFMERALPDVFAPQRNLGVMINNDAFDQRLAWAIGIFRQTDDFPANNDSDDDQGAIVTARVTGLPWYADEGRKVLHLGLSGSHRNPDGAMVRYMQRPEAHLANAYLDTERNVGFRITDLRADDVDLYGLESALSYGPLLIQGEYMGSRVDTTLGGTLDFNGYYVSARYMLTGENRPYKLGKGVFGQLKPKRNFAFGERKGWGAWELALRYSVLDLDDGDVLGGEEDNWTVGINWYLNPNARVMLNYIIADIDHYRYEGRLDTLQTRFQINF